MNKGVLFSFAVALQIGVLAAQNPTLGTASAATSAPSAAGPMQADYPALQAHSAALSPEDRERAKQLFATSFSLWQSGDFTAAEIGFKQGLNLDPANALANYYYGDCLVRRKAKAEAKVYLARAATFGGATAEALKAQAELQALSAIPKDITEMAPEEIKSIVIGTWKLTFVCTHPNATAHHTFRIGKIEDNGGITGLDSFNLLNRFDGAHIDGDEIDFEFTHFGLTGHVTSRSQMSGVATRSASKCNWTGEKQ